ncbi:hypothetical protein AKN87_07360 [Thiopseudomonas alkaliphila]|uniref:hypothetical protein n=1 Tax=Thiopseudomonas alkaliphila TaxID=1697053 RepID=UPI00069F7013|nr:hypothetical protein [Thiopseudomonas alkaliphila]AKX44928.1 hypothetical protein AKN87_07360 [Thiopseudomonas alkaliphila]
MTESNKTKICGIVMPISSIDGCAENHWSEVLGIINEAVNDAGFEGNLVSNSDEVGIIHKRIIQNLYDNPIVVCDVSCKNPNVMFELGLRLAFDKPTIIIKDDKTSYSFDTSAIEHLEYPRDLRFNRIVEFKKHLSAKIQATFKRSTEDENYTTFLKHFGEFKVAKIDQTEVSGQEYILEELKSLRRFVQKMDRGWGARNNSNIKFKEYSDHDINICLNHDKIEHIDKKLSFIMSHSALKNIGVTELETDHLHLTADVKPNYSADLVRTEIENLIGLEFSNTDRKCIIRAEHEIG